ncbi:MAG: CatA-like O-acetyltransferase [Bacilli bacterium]|jgi:chloramphenicol O-acetyltransferase type A|nr:CatA-like O-acetyltransferase [Bacilli bacterium]
MKKLNLNEWKGRKHYEWFKTYDSPTYTLTSTLDITEFIAFIKKQNLSFFIPFLYLITKALNEIPEFRLRMMNNDVIEYEVIHPAYTVMTHEGVFDNCENQYYSDFNVFYQETKRAIDQAKVGVKTNRPYNDFSTLDQFYFSSLPWIDFVGVTHPIPKDMTISVPRIVWGKYYQEGNATKIHLNMCVHHGLIDGYPLALAFIKIQEYLSSPGSHILFGS